MADEQQRESEENYAERMTRLLESIEHNTYYSWWTVVWRGLTYGAAFTIGSAFIVVVAGWILSFLGIIPGLGDLISNLQSSLHQ